MSKKLLLQWSFPPIQNILIKIWNYYLIHSFLCNGAIPSIRGFAGAVSCSSYFSALNALWPLPEVYFKVHYLVVQLWFVLREPNYVSPRLSAPEEIVLFGTCMNDCLIKDLLFYFHVLDDRCAQSYVNENTEGADSWQYQGSKAMLEPNLQGLHWLLACGLLF